ncbi:MAG TPA: hypothetical protein VKK81_08195, partial [Candidatus Binatia bacterium]|nr:hypothetical protein [Candidatus Binatia bacterium]
QGKSDGEKRQRAQREGDGRDEGAYTSQGDRSLLSEDYFVRLEQLLASYLLSITVILMARQAKAVGRRITFSHVCSA